MIDDTMFPSSSRRLPRNLLLLTAALTTAIFTAARAQTPSPPAATQPPAKKALTFEVVSIRQVAANAPYPSRMSRPDTEDTADGWRLNDSQMFIVVLSAFQPSTGGAPFYAPGQIQGLPKWTMEQRYQIDARVSDADRAQWQNPLHPGRNDQRHAAILAHRPMQISRAPRK